ncbi:hypothetical protein [Planococcus shenhongbingii]|uniref:Uncharacterized protein n=1 Tax=Planococcus shenhongbingii TaxID=3058398 RepID=A0ABT8NCR9_9BACL|nr:hypothetical protein [Planococcus sp. N017]MDN7245698.1 hypothetical protein [Planococcus sp. N017]
MFEKKVVQSAKEITVNHVGIQHKKSWFPHRKAGNQLRPKIQVKADFPLGRGKSAFGGQMRVPSATGLYDWTFTR